MFQYLTFRAVMVAVTALLIGLAAGRTLFRACVSSRSGSPSGLWHGNPSEQERHAHHGRVLILLAIAIRPAVVRLEQPICVDRSHCHPGFGAIGWVDDWRKVVRKDPEGMRSREKYFWQSVIGLLAALYLVFSISENSNMRVLELFFRWVAFRF